jgi:hypothetical protein
MVFDQPEVIGLGGLCSIELLGAVARLLIVSSQKIIA